VGDLLEGVDLTRLTPDAVLRWKARLPQIIGMQSLAQSFRNNRLTATPMRSNFPQAFFGNVSRFPF
jgi:hypothetical protein